MKQRVVGSILRRCLQLHSLPANNLFTGHCHALAHRIEGIPDVLTGGDEPDGHQVQAVEVEMEILGLSRHGKLLLPRERAGYWDSKTPTMSF